MGLRDRLQRRHRRDHFLVLEAQGDSKSGKTRKKDGKAKPSKALEKKKEKTGEKTGEKTKGRKKAKESRKPIDTASPLQLVVPLKLSACEKSGDTLVFDLQVLQKGAKLRIIMRAGSTSGRAQVRFGEKG